MTSDTLADKIIEFEDEGRDLSDLEEQIATSSDIPRSRARKVIAQEKSRADTLRKIRGSSERAARYVDIHDIDNLTGLQFEKFLAHLLSKIEGEAEVTKGTGDQGVDILWHKSEGTAVIQAKAYRPENKATNSSVQQVSTGSKNYEEQFNIIEKAVITTSNFTESAKEAAEFSDVTLYKRDDIKKWLNDQRIGLDEFGRAIEDSYSSI